MNKLPIILALLLAGASLTAFAQWDWRSERVQRPESRSPDLTIREYPPLPVPSDESTEYQKYASILNVKSIFSKDGTGRTNQSATPPTAPAPVFIGVQNDDRGYVAYVENPANGTIIPLHVGDRLASNQLTVTKISLDHLTVAGPIGTAEIAMGNNVRNEPVNVAVIFPTPVSADNLPASGRATPVNPRARTFGSRQFPNRQQFPQFGQ